MVDTIFDLIISEIENKCKNPLFLIKGVIRDRKYAEEWAERVSLRYRCVKYKRINENIFELKDFFPNPPHNICSKIVTSKINEAKEYFKCTNLYFKIGNVIYSEAEARIQMLKALKDGRFQINILRPNIEKSIYRDDRCISEVEYGRGQIIEEIESGLLSYKME